MTNAVNVLLIEDNPGDACFVTHMLADAGTDGFSVEHVDRLAQALEVLARKTYDVLLVDLGLPDAEGIDVIRQLQVVVPKTPMVVLTGSDDQQAALKIVQAGAQDLLIKGQGGGDLLARALRYAIERKRAEEHLAYLAKYDHLTGLPNRALFRDRLERSISRSQRRGNGLVLALMFLDLDHFKDVNDTLGHDAGDELLREVADRLGACVRESDTVARIGGDEFTVILEDVPNEHVAAVVAQKILDAMAAPFIIQGREVVTTPSIGIATYPQSAPDAATLVKCADRAMYRAKRSGRGRYQFYVAEDPLGQRLRMLYDLRRALEEERLKALYEPLWALQADIMTGAVSILHWGDEHGAPLYERAMPALVGDADLATSLLFWRLQQLGQLRAAWSAANLRMPLFTLPLEANLLRRPHVVREIGAMLERVGVEPPYVEFELGQDILAGHMSHVQSQLNELRGMGCRLAVREFGTEAVVLDNLATLPIDQMRLAPQLVADAVSVARRRSLLGSLVALAHGLDIHIGATGVDTPEQLAMARDCGIDYICGKVVAEALTPAQLLELVKSGPTMTMQAASRMQ